MHLTEHIFNVHYIHKVLIHHLSIGGWFKRMELIEVKSLIWAQKGKLYIIYENVMWILGILRFKSIHLLFYTFIHIIHMYTRYFKSELQRVITPYFWKWWVFAYFLCAVVLSTSEKIAYMYTFKIMFDRRVIQ